jgi:hypothetical protein
MKLHGVPVMEPPKLAALAKANAHEMREIDKRNLPDFTGHQAAHYGQGFGTGICLIGEFKALGIGKPAIAIAKIEKVSGHRRGSHFLGFANSARAGSSAVQITQSSTAILCVRIGRSTLDWATFDKRSGAADRHAGW